ncbi:DUF6350 family protein [Streptomyces sp. HSG2]|uniref:cell division protein PerM n=1 Tax=Streptomyces sp. HSG2 TaxID=2797167 RepID=UPI001F5B9910|nr:DUF6350 family protein [Streptomyces sp. HSG2]
MPARRLPRPSPVSRARARWRDRPPGISAGLAGGAAAAALGIAAFGAVVTLLWISAPAAGGNPDGALRVAAALWLSAHGADLVRVDTLSGAPAPLGVTPLLFVLLPFWLVRRACREATDGTGGLAVGSAVARGSAPPPVSARLAWCGVVLGYLAVAAPVVWYAAGGPLRPAWVSTVVGPVLVVTVAAAAGVWTAFGRPGGPVGRALAGLPRGARLLLVEPDARPGPVTRAAGAATGVLCGGGALLLTGSLLVHHRSVGAAFARAAEGWSEQGAVLLLCAALVPNAAVWAVAYSLGPGFLLGVGHTAGPLSAEPPPPLPPLPLFSAVPRPAGAGSLLWTTGALPLAAGLTLGWFLGRSAARGREGADEARPWTKRRTAVAVLVAAGGCAALVALLAALSGGPLGVHALAAFGPVWWPVGAVAWLWTLGTGLPVALLVRAWHRRADARWERRPDHAGAAGVSPAATSDAASRRPGPRTSSVWRRRLPWRSIALPWPRATSVGPPSAGSSRPLDERPAGEDAYDLLPEDPVRPSDPPVPTPVVPVPGRPGDTGRAPGTEASPGAGETGKETGGTSGPISGGGPEVR